MFEVIHQSFQILCMAFTIIKFLSFLKDEIYENFTGIRFDRVSSLKNIQLLILTTSGVNERKPTCVLPKANVIQGSRL